MTEPKASDDERPSEAAMHETHCNQGEYKGSCKYGEADCPALVIDRAMVAGEPVSALCDDGFCDHAAFPHICFNPAPDTAALVSALEEANGILEDALREVGDDYPGSSCQAWCQQQVKLARAIIAQHKGTEHG